MTDDIEPAGTRNRRELRLVESDGETMIFEERQRATPEQMRRAVQRKYGKQQFAMLSRDALHRCRRVLTPTEMYLLQTMVMETDSDTGEVRLTVASLGEITGIGSQRASNAMQPLLRRRLVKRLGQGRYVVNPHVGWKGNSDGWYQHMYYADLPDWSTPGGAE